MAWKGDSRRHGLARKGVKTKGSKKTMPTQRDMRAYQVVGYDSIRYDDWYDLQERLKSFPVDTSIHSAKRGWADISWTYKFYAKNDSEARNYVEKNIEADTIDLYRLDTDEKHEVYIEGW